MNHMNPEELKQIMSDYSDWAESLGEGGYVFGQKLEDQGAIMFEKGGEILTDDPFLEAKEIIAGFFMIKAKDQTQANAMAQTSPHLGLYSIEVRPVATPKM